MLVLIYKNNLDHLLINRQLKKISLKFFTLERYFFVCSDYFIYICNI